MTVGETRIMVKPSKGQATKQQAFVNVCRVEEQFPVVRFYGQKESRYSSQFYVNAVSYCDVLS